MEAGCGEGIQSVECSNQLLFDRVGLDYHDVYRDWFKRRDIEEDGMLLVRPGRYVAG